MSDGCLGGRVSRTARSPVEVRGRKTGIPRTSPVIYLEYVLTGALPGQGQPDWGEVRRRRPGRCRSHRRHHAGRHLGRLTAIGTELGPLAAQPTDSAELMRVEKTTLEGRPGERGAQAPIFRQQMHPILKDRIDVPQPRDRRLVPDISRLPRREIRWAARSSADSAWTQDWNSTNDTRHLPRTRRFVRRGGFRIRSEDRP